MTEEEIRSLAEIHDETRTIRTEELIAWAKNHPLFEATPYDSVVDFSRLD